MWNTPATCTGVDATCAAMSNAVRVVQGRVVAVVGLRCDAGRSTSRGLPGTGRRGVS